ncbi:MAG TPA: hypothetical protein DEH22_01130 [Chloroflexi bacterium]|nr:hypothetical protein [Chloroflexota bacterium]
MKKIHRQTKKEINMEFEGYCVKCREKKTVTNGKVEETSNGRRMAKGTCPTCNTKVSRFLPKEDK